MLLNSISLITIWEMPPEAGEKDISYNRMEQRMPSPGNLDRDAIHEMLVARDSEAFLAQDWHAVKGDFVTNGFFGIDARHSADAANWRLTFASLDAYRDEWLRQAADTAATADPALAAHALRAATRIRQIDITGDMAFVHKCFDGIMPLRDGGTDRLLWQTRYVCRREQGRWKIASFVGYLPFAGFSARAYRVAASTQHKTAGPYSPAISVDSDARTIVLSGQAPLDDDGDVVGATIEAQARVMLDNCRTQLSAAGLDFGDVFKATVFLTDLAEWDAFNTVYREYFEPPYPARTAVQTGLLPGMRVEIELWAARR